jgi:regulator of protease activity HflC (stomatin/prohibitin superfamily)
MGDCCCFAVISTAEVGVIERFGKFSRFAEVKNFKMSC